MDESRQSSSGARAVLRRMAPPPALCGFLLLLALMFAVSYAVGAAAGPVAPGMHGTETSRGGLDDGGAGSGTDTGGMGGMHGGGG
ncbi:hypothetical protein [Streptomyces sp. NRRL S-1813]|uniref:hypothetical protein n=1 Tax=Streptomyces sp. NRRL S-1813 TaxID=1463888 RepID=UPI0004CAEBCC|nr:hypothetical protein [Streptomyces sp. NRRL S-1813]